MRREAVPGRERPARRWRLRPVAVLSSAALAVLAAWVWLLRAKGPYWLGTNSDPEYAYLLNGLALCYGHTPAHVDHPGTPVQILLAAVLRATHLLTGHGSLGEDVIRRPEHYLSAANGVLLVLLAGALAAAGLAAWRSTGNVLAGLAVQVLPGLTPIVALNAIGVRPEPFVAALAALVAAQVLCTMAPDRRSGRVPDAVPFGVLVGLAVAGKVTAAPLAVLPLLLLSGLAARALFAAVAVGTMALATLPAWPVLGQFFAFFTRLATHSGLYGSGRKSLLDAAEYLPGLHKLLVGGSGWPTLGAAVTGVGALVALALARRARRDGDPRVVAARDALYASVATQVVSYLAVARHADSHYLMPALVISGLTAALAIHGLTLAMPRRPVLRGVGVALALATCGLHLMCGLREARRLLETERDAQLAVVSTLAERFPGVRVLHHYRSSSPAYALHFGDAFAGARWSTQIHDLYPGHLFYDLWSDRLEAYRPDPAQPFARERLTREVLCGTGGEGALVVQGSLFQDFPATVEWAAELRGQIAPVYASSVEALYWPKECPPPSR